MINRVPTVFNGPQDSGGKREDCKEEHKKKHTRNSVRVELFDGEEADTLIAD